jgi:protein TonB
MLQDSLLESGNRKNTRKPLTVIVSTTAHAAAVLILVVIPLLQTQALTIPPIDASLYLPRVERAQSLTVFSAQPRTQKEMPKSTDAPTLFTSPQTIPVQIAYVDEPPAANIGLPSGPGITGASFPGMDARKALIDVEAPAIASPLPPPSPPPPPSVQTKPYRQGGDVQAARLIHQVNPVYPALARQARIQGIVVLEAVINKEGSIESLRIISGHPLLTQASLDAVRQWKYRPTILNGEPVDVITTVTITFKMQ